MIEILVTGEDKKPLSFLKLDSRRLSNKNIEANKAIFVSDVVYFNSEDLILLLKRAQEVASQRKHDSIWVEVFQIDIILTETVQSLGFERFDYEENNSNDNYPKRIYFRKQIQQIS